MSVMEATTSMATTTVMEEATTATAGAPSSSTSTSTKRRRVARPAPLVQDILGDGSGPSSSSNAKWVCSYNGCNKSFQRSDHLARHKLNHSASFVYACDKCDRTFVRPDLLKRHAERHIKREASGYSSLPTPGRIKGAPSKKRSITDLAAGTEQSISDNNAGPSTRRPPKAQRPFGVQQQNVQSTISSAATSAVDPQSLPMSAASSFGPPLDETLEEPSFEALMNTTASSLAYSHDHVNSLLAPQRSRSMSPTSAGLLLNALIAQQANDGIDLPLLSTAPSSHFGTASEFSALDPNGGIPTSKELEMALAQVGVFSSVGVNADAPFLSSAESNWLFTQAGIGSPWMTLPYSTPIMLGDPLMLSQPDDSINMPPSIPPVMTTTNTLPITQRTIPPRRTTSAPMPPSILKPPHGSAAASINGSTSNTKTTHFRDGPPIGKDPSPEVQLPRKVASIVQPPHIPPQERVTNMCMSESARLRMLAYLAPLRDFQYEPLFKASALTEYLHRFFEWDMSHFSIMHKPSFQPDDADPALVCAIVCIGCFFSNNDAHWLATDIHRFNITTVLTSPKFQARTDLQTIQATLLMSIYGRTMSTVDLHEHAHMIYPAFQMMYRRSALFNERQPCFEHLTDPIARWHAWRDEEACRRAAFASYAFDILCSMLFRQIAIMSAFQIALTLPCGEDEWHAGTAQEWQRRHDAATKPLSFLPTLKAFLVPGLTTPQLSPLARSICLFGLISVAFDMQWREFFLLGLSTHPDGLVKEWRLTLTSAYNCWKTRLDVAIVDNPAALGTQLLRNVIPIYAIAHCTLAIDIDELQIFAGARRALGLPVPPSVIESTHRRVLSWSNTKGKEAAWHAAHFLRSNLLTRRPIEDGRVHPIFLGWCLYLAAICVHAYGNATVQSRKIKLDDEDRYEEPLVYLDAICTKTPDSIGVANIGNDLGMLEAVLEVLHEDTRWGLAREAGEILSRPLGETE